MTPTQIRAQKATIILAQKATIILAQVFISCLMALSMTLIFGTLLPHHGLPAGWLTEWLTHFIAAWPVAFIFSLAIGPLSFALSGAIIRRVM